MTQVFVIFIDRNVRVYFQKKSYGLGMTPDSPSFRHSGSSEPKCLSILFWCVYSVNYSEQ